MRGRSFIPDPQVAKLGWDRPMSRCPTCRGFLYLDEVDFYQLPGTDFARPKRRRGRPPRSAQPRENAV